MFSKFNKLKLNALKTVQEAKDVDIVVTTTPKTQKAEARSSVYDP